MIGLFPSYWNKAFALQNDIDLSGVSTAGFNLIGTVGTNFTGTFDGLGHSISNLTYATGMESYVGLFGYAFQAAIQNTGVVNVLISSQNRYAGGLVGYQLTGTITNCHSTGSVTSTGSAGGLAGYSTGIITNCYSRCSVTIGATGSYIGGLVGQQVATISKIEKCYSTGAVSGGSDYKGGLMGSRAGIVNTSFWDTQTSGMATSAGGTGKTTVEMKMLLTFTGGGWDFVDETANGTQDIWRMCTGTSYPKFAWQTSTPGDFVCPEGVDMLDLDVFLDQWLLHTNLAANIVKDDVVNLLDWQKLASAWMSSTGQPNWNSNCDIAPVGGDGQINQLDLMMMAGQWMEYEAWNADIAPVGGDGFVDLLDFKVFASNWLLEQ
jgi:hypothetical protein